LPAKRGCSTPGLPSGSSSRRGCAISLCICTKRSTMPSSTRVLACCYIHVFADFIIEAERWDG
jgi:hypothetical protein